MSPDIELVKNNIPYELKDVFGYSEEVEYQYPIPRSHLPNAILCEVPERDPLKQEENWRACCGGIDRGIKHINSE